MATFNITPSDLDALRQFFGTEEADTIRPENSSEDFPYTIFGLGGNDSLVFGNGDDVILAGEGNDTVTSGNGDDTVFGMEGNDSIQGSAGEDVIFGNQDDDFIIDSFDNDTVYGGRGNDTINLRNSVSDDERNIAFGNLGNDSLDGSRTSDSLFGGQDNDTLIGNDGNDTLSGDRGRDVISGGDGNDLVFLRPTLDLTEIPTGTENTDFLIDFVNGEDTIALIGVSFEQLVLTPLTPQQVDQRFGSGTVATTFPINITTYIDLRIGNESLGIVGGGDNFILQSQDFITL